MSAADMHVLVAAATGVAVPLQIIEGAIRSQAYWIL